MSLFSTENHVRCGRCGTEFDLNKNKNECPLCGFGKATFQEVKSIENFPIKQITTGTERSQKNYLTAPIKIDLPNGKIVIDYETKRVGLWGMFNDFFSGKFLLRVSANMLIEEKKDFVSLRDLIEKSKIIMLQKDLLTLKGFPNDINAESAVGRLVYHFLAGYHKMGLFEIKLNRASEDMKENMLNEPWENVLIRPTSEGLEFARLKNHIFDEHDYENQILTEEEREWMINYLKTIEKKGFKEYYLLNQIVSFLKKGKTGNKDLWDWLKKNPEFVSYVKERSGKSKNPKAFERQLENLSKTFGASKISLLRELGIIKNKRDDYTIIGEI